MRKGRLCVFCQFVASRYDVILPMGYYTYHGNGVALASNDTVQNMRVLRAQRGCKKVPVHLIGGLTEKTSLPEVRAFARAAQREGAWGASLYGWAGTSGPMWRHLSRVGTL